MTEYAAIRDKKRRPTHPGAAIAHILADVDVSKTRVAKLLNISRQHLHTILAGRKPFSAPIAVRVAALLGGSPESWLPMHASYDAWEANRTVDLSRIKRLEAV